MESSLLTPPESHTSLHTAVSQYNIAVLEIWKDPSGDPVQLLDHPPHKIYHTISVGLGFQPRSIAIVQPNRVYVECESERECESINSQLHNIDELGEENVKVKGVKAMGDLYRHYRQVMHGLVPGVIYTNPGIDVDGTAEDRGALVDAVCRDLNREERELLLQKLQGAIPKTPKKTLVEMPAVTANISSVSNIESTNNVGRGLTIGKPPKFSQFSGEVPVPKGEVSYEQWKYEIVCTQGMYTEVLITEGIRRSVRGQAADMARFMGPNVSPTEILKKLDVIFGRIATVDTLMQEFYKLVQGKTEKVATFAGRLEDALNHIRGLHPHSITGREVDSHLKERLFHGIRSSLRDSVRYLYDHSTYHQLLVAIRKSESESDEDQGQSTSFAC